MACVMTRHGWFLTDVHHSRMVGELVWFTWLLLLGTWSQLSSFHCTIYHSSLTVFLAVVISPVCATYTVRPTRPASRVTRSCLPASGADESIQEDHSTAYTHTCPINGSTATSTNLPHPGIYALGQLTRQASALMGERGHASSQRVNRDRQEHDATCVAAAV